MVFIFTGDTHFDSAFSGEDSFARNGELIKCFENAVGYAEKIGARAVVLGGDLFDTPYPSPETKSFIKNIIEAHGGLQFIAVSGNHDPLYSTVFYQDTPDNFYLFPDKITKYEFEGVTFYGKSEKGSDYDRDTWKGFKGEGRFITLSHGNFFPASLADTGAALCLMGHIHKSEVHTLSSGAKAIYCGALAGRGFDECGEKGFYVIDTDDMSYRFVASDAKIYSEYEVDISCVSDTAELISLLQTVEVRENEIARAILTGNVKEPFSVDCKKLCSLLPRFCEIKDCSGIDINVTENISLNTLEGEFLRILAAKLEKAEPNEKQKILDAMKEGVIALRRKV